MSNSSKRSNMSSKTKVKTKEKQNYFEINSDRWYTY